MYGAFLPTSDEMFQKWRNFRRGCICFKFSTVICWTKNSIRHHHTTRSTSPSNSTNIVWKLLRFDKIDMILMMLKSSIRIQSSRIHVWNSCNSFPWLDYYLHDIYIWNASKSKGVTEREMYICWLVTCSFPRKYKNSMQCTKWSYQQGLYKSASRPQFCT